MKDTNKSNCDICSHALNGNMKTEKSLCRFYNSKTNDCKFEIFKPEYSLKEYSDINIVIMQIRKLLTRKTNKAYAVQFYNETKNVSLVSDKFDIIKCYVVFR